ncbi:hypothetical protein CC78DRAFT_412951, partial [Lojkania enalia]
VVITGTKDGALNDTKTEIEAVGKSSSLKVITLKVDFSNSSIANHIADVVESTHGCLYLLVDNAAIVS